MNIIDIVLIALIIVIVVQSAKKGFVASCLDTLSLAISGFVSYTFCQPIAQRAYDMFICDLVKTEFRQALDDMSSSLSVQQKVQGMLEALPETALKLVESMGISVESLSSSVMSSVTSSEEALIENVANTIAPKVMLTFTEVIVFICLFILVALLVRLFSNFFSHNLEKIPVVGQLDTVLGGALGVVKAIVLLAAVNVILYIIVSTSESGSPMEMIETSKIYLFLMEHNPIIDIIRGN